VRGAIHQRRSHGFQGTRNQPPSRSECSVPMRTQWPPLQQLRF
jgi:hypothetical protein